MFEISFLLTLVYYGVTGLIGVLIPYAVYEFVCAKLRGDCFPEAFPFQTSLALLMNDQHNDMFLKWTVQMEEVALFTRCFNLFGLPWLVVTNDIKNVTHTLKNVKTYGKGPKWYARMSNLLGLGIFNADGDLWYKHRKTSSHLFNMNKFRNEMSHVFNEHCTILMQCIYKKSNGKTNSGSSSSFDMQDLFQKFTIDSIGKIAFGKTIGALEQERVLFAESFDFCQFQANASFIDPLWVFKRYLTPTGWLFHYHIRRLNRFAYDLVRER